MSKLATSTLSGPAGPSDQRVVETANAKINLALHVTGRRDDGYHLLDSLVVFSQFGDELSLSASNTPSNELEISGPFAAGLNKGLDKGLDKGMGNERGHQPDNLILQAHRALNARLSQDLPATHFHLTKNLPIASGIGGGSANAAAALRGLIKLWNINIPQQTLLDIALKLGADVPVCLTSRACRMRGIGEVIDTVENFAAIYMVLVNCGVHVSTPEIFSALSLPKNQTAFEPLGPFDQLSCFSDWNTWLKTTRNDMQASAIAQSIEIAETLDLIEQTENLKFSRMSGSGATCFGLYETHSDAQIAAEFIGKEKPNWWVVASNAS